MHMPHNTLIQTENRKKRKLYAVMMGASVPRSSPRQKLQAKATAPLNLAWHIAENQA